MKTKYLSYKQPVGPEKVKLYTVKLSKESAMFWLIFNHAPAVLAGIYVLGFMGLIYLLFA